ncbi:MAG: nucleotidyltransferase family protein [Deltaproteobacteria bacterium]|nr:nucleotidyltransferase family protein [Deltaproteobacteria bacterium]
MSAHALHLSPEQILAKLRDLQSQAQQKYKAEIKGIFGSVVRGETRTGSDLDVLVEFQATANLLDFVGLANFIEDTLHCPVDIVPAGSLREEIKPAVLEEALYL